MTDLVNDSPIYHQLPVTDFQGNPLVEALLPPPGSKEEAINSLSLIPNFNESDRGLASCFRALLPGRLLNFMFPTTQHAQFQAQIYGQIMNGYRWRNPATVHGQQFLHGDAATHPEIRTAQQQQSFFPQVPATISFLTGLSGMGKSTLIRAVMRSIGKPVIKHTNYNGAPFNETQILYMMRNVPDQCSAKAVCKSFGDHADELLSMNLYAKLFEDKSMTRTHYVATLRKIVANHHIGALIIDEFQNIALNRSGGKKEFLALILNLREELGIPIILVGTYRAAAVLREEASIARRLVEGGFLELRRPGSHEDRDWRALCEVAWGFQWVQKPQALDEEVIEVLYNCSQGITGIMLNLFVTAQTFAIQEGIETVTPSFIKEVYEDRFRPLHPIIDILSRNDENELANYDDLYFDSIKTFKREPIQSRLDSVLSEMHLKQEELQATQQATRGTGKATPKSKNSRNLPSTETLREVLHNTCFNENPLFGGKEA